MNIIEYENLCKTNAQFFEDFTRTFADVVNEGWYILGHRSAEFERKFAAYCKSRHCIGVASGLDALTLGLDALELPPESEVIVPSNTYIATIIAIVRNGLKPVLVEPDIRTYNIDPGRIEEAITPATTAIIVVHLYGKCCDMDPILEIARRRGLRIVEDCSQSHGARYKGRLAGGFGDLGAFSFYPSKNLGALGDAGAVTTNQDAIKDRIATLRNYGSRLKYHNELVGYNSRLDELQAAFLTVKLAALDSINTHKRELAAIYMDRLNDNFALPIVDRDFYDVYHIFNVRHSRRDDLREYLARHGVKTEVHYPVPPRQQKAMQGILDGFETPIADEIHATTVSLPIAFFHTPDEIHSVVDIMNAFPEGR